MKFRYLLACMVFVLAGVGARGQDRGGLSLSQLWKQAFANYPSLDAHRSQQHQADINQRLMRRQFLPDVHLQIQNALGTQHAVSGAFFPLPGLYNVSGPESGSASAYAANIFGSVVVDWKFLQFGKQKKSVEATEILSNQTAHSLDAEQLRIQTEVSKVYLQVFFRLGMEAWAHKNTERLHAILKASASRADAGLSPGADSLLVKATLNQTRADLNFWQGRRAEAKMVLANWINMPANQFTLNRISILRTGGNDKLHVRREDQMLHPLLALKEGEIAYAEKQEALASVSALPSISLLSGAQMRGNSMNTEHPISGKLEDSYNSPVHNYAVGIALTWNVGNAFDARWERKRYQAALRQREAEAQEAALHLQRQEAIARLQITQSRYQIEEVEQAYESAHEAYALFDARYKSGLISITELLQIQDVLQKTEKARIEAYYQYWIHKVSLAQSTTDFSHLEEAFD